MRQYSDVPIDMPQSGQVSDLQLSALSTVQRACQRQLSQPTFVDTASPDTTAGFVQRLQSAQK
jgi:hypothetical protein